MKLFTLNIAGYKDWENRQDAIVEILNIEKPDIVLLQEVHFDFEKSGFSQATMINQQLDAQYSHTIADVTKHYTPSVGKSYREGLAILTHYELIASETLALDKADDDKHVRICQLIDLCDGTDVVRIAHVHFSNNQYSKDQLREVLSILKARNEHRIIVGDFNILDIDEVRNDFADDYLLSYDYTQYVSFLSENRTLDYMLLPKEYQYDAIATKSNMSDHEAVVIDLEKSGTG